MLNGFPIAIHLSLNLANRGFVPLRFEEMAIAALSAQIVFDRATSPRRMRDKELGAPQGFGFQKFVGEIDWVAG